jgi:hypothetical protein
MIATLPPAPQPVPLETLLSRSWVLFRRNWIVAMPPIIATVVIALAAAAIFGSLAVTLWAHRASTFTPQLGGGFALGLLVVFVVIVAAGVWSEAAMFGMADAVWVKGTTTFGDGFAAFERRGVALLLAGVGIVGLVIVAFILALPTLGLAFIALPLFTMYVIPSVVTGGRDGFTAIGESFRLVQRFFGASAIVLLVLIAIQYGISMVASVPLYVFQFATLTTMESHKGGVVPALGALVLIGVWFVFAMIVLLAYKGYYTIAIVGLYRSLFAPPAVPPPPPASGPLMPT